MEMDPQDLPADAGLLRQIVLQLLGVVEEKDRLLERVQHQLEQLLRQRYGQKRERLNENQLFLFAAQIVALSQRAHATTAVPETSPAESASRAASGEKKTHPGHGRNPLPAALERRRVVFDLDPAQRQCPHCQAPMQKIGEDVSERLEFIPASLQVIEEVRPKYACAKGCGVAAAPKPAAPIEKGLPGPGLLAQVVVSKYGDHLPLNRLEGIFERQGVELPRQTMCDWMGACAELVRPVWERMKQFVLGSKVIQTDDTPVPVQDEELTHTRKGRIWTYVGDRHHPGIVYDYTGNRRGEGPEEFLKDYRGYVQADAYAGYDALFKNRREDVTEVGCWAHVRRKFFEAQTSDVCRATVVLAYIGLLYEVERETHNSNLNAAERSLSHIVVGRNNWLFYGSDNGGRTGAILTSLIATCKRLHIEPFAYLRDLFARISAHPQSRLDDLLPHRWQANRSAAES